MVRDHFGKNLCVTNATSRHHCLDDERRVVSGGSYVKLRGPNPKTYDKESKKISKMMNEMGKMRTKNTIASNVSQ